MKTSIENMIEGPEAWERFRAAVKAVLKVPKSAMPPSPFGKSGKKRKKPDPQRANRLSFASRASAACAPSQLTLVCPSGCLPVRSSQVSRLPTICEHARLEAVEVIHLLAVVVAVSLFIQIAE